MLAGCLLIFPSNILIFPNSSINSRHHFLKWKSTKTDLILSWLKLFAVILFQVNLWLFVVSDLNHEMAVYILGLIYSFHSLETISLNWVEPKLLVHNWPTLISLIGIEILPDSLISLSLSNSLISIAPDGRYTHPAFTS